MVGEENGLKRNGETIDEFFQGRLKILQKKKGYRFSVDSLLLADFATLQRGDRVIDLGTGSGIIALILALRFPETTITAVEIQEDLADMAARSVVLNNMSDRIRVWAGDVKKIRGLFSAQSFDAAIFNPPYRRLDSGRINPDGEKAIARHEIKGTLEDFLAFARYLLKESGRVYAIYPAKRIVQIITAMRGNGVEPKRLRVVHSNKTSGGVFILVEGIKGAGEEAKILPPLFIYRDDGRYSDEMQRILNGSFPTRSAFV